MKPLGCVSSSPPPPAPETEPTFAWWYGTAVPLSGVWPRHVWHLGALWRPPAARTPSEGSCLSRGGRRRCASEGR